MDISRDPRSAENEITFADTTLLKYLDIEVVQDGTNEGPGYRAENGRLQSGEVEEWLRSVGAQHAGTTGLHNSAVDLVENQTSPRTASLRILYGSCFYYRDLDVRYVPIKSRDFEIINDFMRLPRQWHSSLRRVPASAFTVQYIKTNKRPSSSQFVDCGFEPEICHIMKYSIFRPSFYHVAISHDSSSNTTYCLILSKNKDHEFPILMERILSLVDILHHPMCVALHLAELCIDASEGRLRDVDAKLSELEEVTGQHEWTNRPIGDPLEMNFLKVGRRLNFNSRILGVEKMRTSALRETLEEIRRVDTQPNLEVEQLLRYYENACEMLQCSIEYQDRRVQSQLGVVYQYMTQKDSKINIELAATSATIARETKKDGSAMKTIAIVTMFFLPSTFLAALFAMPLFNWDGDGPVIKSQFKWYWAIAIPLTFLVMLVWATIIFLPWSKWIATWSKRRKVDEKLRKEV